MREMKALLLINLISGGAYTLVLLVRPGQVAGTIMGPQEIAWVRYLVPIYLALTVASWHAFRDPQQNMAVIQALLVMWTGLVLVHLLNAVFGDEQLSETMPLVVFDAIMAAAFAYIYPRARRAAQLRS